MGANIEAKLERAEEALARGEPLTGTGFWPAVASVKADPALLERYADRIGRIDRRAFEAGVRLRVPLWFGLLALGAVSVTGMLAVLAARLAGGERFFGDPLHEVAGGRAFVPLAFLFGLGALLVGTHCLAHYLVGRPLGIRFTHVFLGGPPPPRPGLKTAYASYLRASPRARAVMHASGALVTKTVPFALLVASVPLYGEWPWLTWLLIGLGLTLIATDVIFYAKSDWKKVSRELAVARAQHGPSRAGRPD